MCDTKDKAHEIINEISDICNTAMHSLRITMTVEEVTRLYFYFINKIDQAAVYPDE